MYDNTWVRGRKELNTLRFLKKISDLQGTQKFVRMDAVMRLGRDEEAIVHHVKKLSDAQYIKVGVLDKEAPHSLENLACGVLDSGKTIIGYPLSVMEMLVVEQ